MSTEKIIHLDPNAPEWLRGAVRDWVEDDSGDPERETVTPAWRRIVGGQKPSEAEALAKHDYGDEIFYLHKLGAIECHSFDGKSIWHSVAKPEVLPDGAAPINSPGTRRRPARKTVPIGSQDEGRKVNFPSPELPRSHEGISFDSEAEARAYGYEPKDLAKERRIERGELTPEERRSAGVEIDRIVSEHARSVSEPGREDKARRDVAMSPAFERILSTTFSIDVLRISDELEGQLAIPDADRVDFGFLAKRAGEASENARKAHLLYVNAVAAREEFEARAETSMAALRVRAHESLAELESQGKLGKKKTITNDDVEAEMARIAPDEFERVKVKRAKVKLMVAQLERQADLFKHFPHTIESLLSTSRSP